MHCQDNLYQLLTSIEYTKSKLKKYHPEDANQIVKIVAAIFADLPIHEQSKKLRQWITEAEYDYGVRERGTKYVRKGGSEDCEFHPGTKSRRNYVVGLRTVRVCEKCRWLLMGKNKKFKKRNEEKYRELCAKRAVSDCETDL